MADIRINALATTAASTASDDFVAVDGSANGTRKLNAYSPTFGGNLTVSGTGLFGGATGPHTFGNGTGAVEVRAVGDSSGYYGYSFYTGGSYESSLKHTAGSGILKLDVGRNSAWGGTFEIYADTTRAARFAKTSTTLDGNLTVSGTGLSSVAGGLKVQSVEAVGTPASYNSTGGIITAGYAGSSYASIKAYSDASGTEKSLTLQPASGAVLLGTTTNSSNGKLQLADHTTSAGGIGFGTDLSLYRANTGFLILNDASAALDARIGLYNNGTQRGLFEAYNVNTAIWMGAASAGWSTIITSGNQATALTLDSSQNATFAGNVTIASGKQLITNGSVSGVGFSIYGDTAIRAQTNGSGNLYIDTNKAGAVIYVRAGTVAQSAVFAADGVDILGTTTNDSAAAGYVGEYVSSRGTSVALTSNTNTNVTSISLTAGDWDVEGSILISPSGTLTLVVAGVSSTSATYETTEDGATYLQTTFGAGQGQQLSTGARRYSLSATTTIYLIGKGAFASGTTTANGVIRARRVR